MQRNKFEMAAHDIQYKKKHHADHGQLGDEPLFDEIDWLFAGIVGALVVLFIAVALTIK